MSILEKCYKFTYIFVCALGLTISAQAHTHQHRMRIYIDAPKELKARIDSTTRSIDGVIKASWNSRRKFVFIVYNSAKTSPRKIRKILGKEGFYLVKQE